MIIEIENSVPRILKYDVGQYNIIRVVLKVQEDILAQTFPFCVMSELFKPRKTSLKYVS